MKVKFSTVLSYLISAPLPPSPSCYLAGTMITTIDGPRKIEELEIGSQIVTGDGHLRPIKWVGRRTYRKSRRAWQSRMLPVMISAGSLGKGLPLRDLYVSQKHEIFVDGNFVRAVDLINGATIWLASYEHEATLQYFHVATEAHEIIMAEGVPSETLRCRGRMLEKFENFGEYLALYPDEKGYTLARCAPLRRAKIWNSYKRRQFVD